MEKDILSGLVSISLPNGNVYSTSTSTAGINTWSFPIRMDIIENNDSIEMIYKETSTMQLAIYPPISPQERIFKIIFSCVDGKWNKSERIYGEIIPSSEESYRFD